MSFTHSAAMKSEVFSGIEQEATDDTVVPMPRHVPRKSRTMLWSSLSSATTSPTTSGVKRKASSDMSGDTWIPRRNHSSVTTTGTPSTAGSGDSALFSDSSDISIASSGTSGERIASRNSYAVNIGDTKVNVPGSRKRPTTELYIKMVVGPRVNIVVGPEKKSFELPKDLLAYYSPVFDRSFNGNFKESQTQTMELPEDTVGDFEVLVEYVFHHGVGDKLSISEDGRHAAKRCISFLKYADQYDLGDVSTLVCDALRPALIEGGASAFEPSLIEVVFSLTKHGNCLRELIADAALSFQGEELSAYPEFRKANFKKQEFEVEGFAVALYRQITKLYVGCMYRSPFDPSTTKTFD
ncbi:hypothetical protein BOTNAR_0009g00510 [Botryotinia narcissicola]|uniref:BTB domain-containing protein n=1 Tax=Botryotinia narcissicola TaxID=278944 RepID=A0A4Z1J8S4_9HELO|nr:hypothetical protein BOTNAR_0009g00510 [Botryotinia narcissicola]